jgi:hypothetical protein
MEHIKTLIQYGNKKLPKTTAIFNMGSASDCPSDKLGMCAVSEQCYAKKAERMYPQVLPYRRRQRNKWLKTSGTQLAFELLESFEKKRKKPTHLRLNEAGDFYSQDCVDKAEEIARKLKSIAGVQVYVYTARKDLDYSQCKHLVINGSGFRKEGITRSFTAVADVNADKSAFICEQDCNVCSMCSTTEKKNIVVEYH